MKNSASKVLTAIAIAAASLIASSAIAKSAASTIIDNDTTIHLKKNGEGDFGDNFKPKDSGKNFISNFSFDLRTASDLNAGLFSVKNNKTDLSINNFDLYSKNGTLMQKGTQLSSGTFDIWTLSFNHLASGSYFVSAMGKVLGTKGGNFDGKISVSPVPEPATWGMMIGGMALVAFAARRRKSVEVNSGEGLAAA